MESPCTGYQLPPRRCKSRGDKLLDIFNLQVTIRLLIRHETSRGTLACTHECETLTSCADCPWASTDPEWIWRSRHRWSAERWRSRSSACYNRQSWATVWAWLSLPPLCSGLARSRLRGTTWPRTCPCETASVWWTGARWPEAFGDLAARCPVLRPCSTGVDTEPRWAVPSFFPT